MKVSRTLPARPGLAINPPRQGAPLQVHQRDALIAGRFPVHLPAHFDGFVLVQILVVIHEMQEPPIVDREQDRPLP